MIFRDGFVLSLVLFLLGAGCGASVESSLKDLLDGETDVEDRIDAALNLADERARHASDELIQAMTQDPSPVVRATCARCLARLATDDAETALLEALADDDGLVRWEAVAGLGLIAATGTWETVAKHLLEDDSPDVRRECAKVLSRFQSVGAVSALISALEDREPSVRLHAEIALTRITCRDFGPRAEDWQRWAKGFASRMSDDGGG